jgi:acetyl esterase/lipase
MSEAALFTTHSYGGDALQTYDLFRPAAAATGESARPAVVFVHGGLWVSRDKADYAGVGACLAARGFVTAVVNYRLTSADNGVRPPDHTRDLATALHAIAALLSDTPHRGLVLFGHSCGAHMAAQAVLEAQRFDTRALDVRGVVGASGLYDLPQYAADFPAWAPYLHVTWTADAARWESPQSVAFRDADASPHALRWLVVHFVGDSYVNDTQARQFLAKLRAAEPRFVAAVDEAFLPGEHFEAVNSVALVNAPDSPAAHLVDALLEFLNKMSE